MYHKPSLPHTSVDHKHHKQSLAHISVDQKSSLTQYIHYMHHGSYNPSENPSVRDVLWGGGEPDASGSYAVYLSPP